MKRCKWLNENNKLTIKADGEITKVRYGYTCKMTEQIQKDVSQMVTVYDENGKIIFTNKTFKKLYDYARNGILNKTLPKVLFKGNYILVSFLQLIDMRLVMLFKQKFCIFISASSNMRRGD